MSIRIVAEIAQGYEGKVKLVEEFVRAAAFAKADAIKFQIFYADELALPDYQYYSLFKKLEIPFTEWKKAVKLSHKNGMEFYSDVFGLASLEELKKIGVDGYKIHATDANNLKLLKAVGKTKKKTLLATAGCEFKEIKTALDALSGCPATLMFGFQAEPTQIKDNHLMRIKALKDKFGRPVGFMDHTQGDHALRFYLPFIAIGCGADLIEKHMTLKREDKLEDYISALSSSEFAEWTRLIRESESALGEASWKLNPEEVKYRTKIKRAVCAGKNIPAKKVLREDDLELKRSGSEQAIFDLSQVIGKKVNKDVKQNELISRSVLS